MSLLIQDKMDKTGLKSRCQDDGVHRSAVRLELLSWFKRQFYDTLQHQNLGVITTHIL